MHIFLDLHSEAVRFESRPNRDFRNFPIYADVCCSLYPNKKHTRGFRNEVAFDVNLDSLRCGNR